MKIAVASADGALMSQHFGQSRCFIVFTVEEGKILGQEARDNTYTAHAQGQCQGHEEHHHDQHHSHADVIAALQDCQVLLCGGMGWRAAEDLKAKGITPLMVEPNLQPEEAVRQFMDGTLKPGGGFCRCHG